MKKILSVIAAVFIILAVIPNAAISASAAAPKPLSLTEGYPFATIVESAISSGNYNPSAKKTALLDICKIIYDGITAGKSEIIIDLPSVDNNTISSNLSDAASLLSHNCPYIFGWEIPKISRSLGNDNKIHFFCTLVSSQTDRAAKFAEYEAKLDKIIETVPSELTEIGKMLFVYNYLALHYAYDESLSIFDGYTLVTKGTGVCQAYTEVFNSLMYKLGIPCTNALDDFDTHTWNIVELDGKYYHIDTTWSDPSSDAYGRADQSYFLLSDYVISQIGGHRIYTTYEDTRFEYNVSCPDTKYDVGYVWNNSSSTMACKDGEFYFIEKGRTLNGKVLAAIFKTSDFINKHLVTSFTASAWSSEDSAGNTISPLVFSGLSIIGTQIYYNDSSKIMYYDLSNGSTGEVFTCDSTTSMLYSLFYGKGVFRYSAYSESLQNLEVSILDYDIDGNETINSTDVGILRKYILTGDTSFLVDGDYSNIALAKLASTDESAVTIIDFIRIKKLCAAA